MADIQKILNVRLNLKYDSFENWQKSTLVLNAGEAAVAYIQTGDTQEVNSVATPQVLMKIGNGKDVFKDLPFVSARSADVYGWAKAPKKPTYEASEITGISTYISEYVSNEMGIQVDTDHEYTVIKVSDTQYKLMGKAKGDEEYTLECGTIDIPDYDDTQIKADIDALEALVGTDTVANQIAAAITALDLENTYAAKEHTHEMTEVNGLADALDGKETAGAAAAVEGKLEEYKTSNDAEIAAINNEETGILAQAKEYVDEEDIFVTDITTVNALGGIPAGTDLNGLTTHEVLNKLLFPYVAQVVDTPTRTPNSTVLEKGNDQTITSVNVKVTKKSEPITKVELFNGSTSLAVKEGDEVKNGGTFTFSGLSVPVPSTSVVLTVKVTDASGNTVSKNTAGWTFVYPYYIGVCAEGATIDEELVEGLTKKVENKGNKSHTFNTDYQCFVFAYPKAHGVLKSVLDPNNFEILGSFTRSEVSVTGLDGTAQTYYVYVNGASTVSGFTVNFKY